jgi:hypothetical protein
VVIVNSKETWFNYSLQEKIISQPNDKNAIAPYREDKNAIALEI